MSETDRLLKDHLNTNQVKRERMCLEILSVQKDYSHIQPRLPKGGPDSGRDIECYYKEDLCFGAVGFVNDATDLGQHRNQIKKKFKEDLENSLKPNKENNPMPKNFIFFTNVTLTPSIKTELQNYAYKKAINNCDIFDRESIRIILDSNRGYAIRFRYLDIPLSDAEQKDFFSAWADEINSVIGSELKGIDQTTKRIQFLLESQMLLNNLRTIVKLNTSIWEVCEGEFFFQTTLTLKMHSKGLLALTYGGGTKKIEETLEEWEARDKKHTKNSQYGFGFSWLLPDTPQYYRYVEDVEILEYPKKTKENEKRKNILTSKSSSILEVDKTVLSFSTLTPPFVDRHQPTCKLLELDDSWLSFYCNKEISEHIVEVIIMGDGYELLRLDATDVMATECSFDHIKIPIQEKQEEDSHNWTRIVPSNQASCFSIDLMSKTPKRYDW